MYFKSICSTSAIKLDLLFLVFYDLGMDVFFLHRSFCSCSCLITIRFNLFLLIMIIYSLSKISGFSGILCIFPSILALSQNQGARNQDKRPLKYFSNIIFESRITIGFLMIHSTRIHMFNELVQS